MARIKQIMRQKRFIFLLSPPRGLTPGNSKNSEVPDGSFGLYKSHHGERKKSEFTLLKFSELIFLNRPIHLRCCTKYVHPSFLIFVFA